MRLTSLFEDIVARKGKVLIIGLGVTGIETAAFLLDRGIKAVCVESKTEGEYGATSKYVQRCKELSSAGVLLHFGVDALRLRKLLKEISLCVVSPGVPLSHPLVDEVQKKKIPLTGEFELGIELSGLPSVIVTGSNGKSTVVTLVHEMLKAGDIDSYLCGNIGTTVISQLGDILDPGRKKGHDRRYLVVEASSYQLESCESLKPNVGVFLNLSNNHLERHGTMEAYFEAKRNLFVRQGPEDIAIVNTDDQYGARLPQAVKARVVEFGTLKPEAGEYGLIQYDKSAKIDRIRVMIEAREEVYEMSSSRLVGRHTRYNACAAILAARLLGVPQTAVQKVLDVFPPLTHRIEMVGEKNGVVFINDSKSTTVASTAAALETVLESFPPRNVVLMIGGLAKKASWDPLWRLLSENEQKIRAVICFGKDGGMLKRELKRVKMEGIEVPNLKSAVEKVFEVAGHGDVALFSPGCASFDEFKDFEERGDVFKTLVK